MALFLGIITLLGSLFPQTDMEEVYKISGLIGALRDNQHIPAQQSLWSELIEKLRLISVTNGFPFL
ncbi:hypothetical protein [Spirosoma endophyticum]|uniref:hypothetical protein n=1 Tax=Spirosoma endophyticum TaxID=662367 RepID=UPI000B896800|nr:hypothetical protein [Spirosoma endophyticum]